MKALLINSSARKEGNTSIALNLVAEALEAEGIEAEIYQIPNRPIRGCSACGVCGERGDRRCAFKDDCVNEILEKMESADALIVGSPVYYASPSGQMLSVLDRIFYAGGDELFKGKPGGSVCVARRGGATSTLDVLNKYFTISGMPIAPSTYWPIVYGLEPGEAKQDAEGVQEMIMLGKTIAWMLKCFAAGKAAGISYPEMPGGEKAWMHFIR